MKIKHIRNWVSYDEALKLAKEAGGRLATNKELDEELQSGKVNPDDFPCWSGTFVEYKGEDCTVIENGKKSKIKLPLNNGWYEQDKFGIPSGKPSDSKNPNARYLWRLKENKCPVARVYLWLGDGRRYVLLYGRPSLGLGVAIVRIKR